MDHSSKNPHLVNLTGNGITIRCNTYDLNLFDTERGKAILCEEEFNITAHTGAVPRPIISIYSTRTCIKNGFGELLPFPNPKKSVLYIVPKKVAEHLQRKDVIYPYDERKPNEYCGFFCPVPNWKGVLVNP